MIETKKTTELYEDEIAALRTRLRTISEVVADTEWEENPLPKVLANAFGADLMGGLERELTRLERLLRLPSLFYRPGPVTDAMRREWESATGSTEMTTKVMCDAIRRVLGEREGEGDAD